MADKNHIVTIGFKQERGLIGQRMARSRSKPINTFKTKYLFLFLYKKKRAHNSLFLELNQSIFD